MLKQQTPRCTRRSLSVSTRSVEWACMLCPTGAGVVGVSVRRERGSASGAGLQGHPAAAELSGPVGYLAGQRGLSGP